MTRGEEIKQASIEYTFLRGTPMCLGGDAFAELNELNRNYAFEEGATWADKTMIDKACEWLLKNTYKHVDDSRVYMTFTNTVDMIEDFRRTLLE